MIKNIIFDLSEVIISGYHGIEKILEQEASIPVDEFTKRKAETIDYYLDTMRGIHTEDEYWAYLIKDTDWNISVSKLKELSRQNLNIPVKGTLELIKKLKKNYQLILLSDHVKDWMEYIIANNKDIDLFDYKFISYEYGKLKQDEGCFNYVIKEIGINPQETIFIDDLSSNVACAQKVGISGIVFKNADDLEKELRKRKIII